MNGCAVDVAFEYDDIIDVALDFDYVIVDTSGYFFIFHPWRYIIAIVYFIIIIISPCRRCYWRCCLMRRLYTALSVQIRA
jgi:hypothetical protein